MICTNCGTELPESVSFCTNCGQPIAKIDEAAAESAAFTAEASAGAVSAGDLPTHDLGASLESAVQANQRVVDSVEAHAEMAEQAAARWAEAEAEAVTDTQHFGAQPQGGAAGTGTGAPEAPSGFKGAQEAAAGAAAGAAAPFYQQDASPNAHYSSQRTYDQDAYGQSNVAGKRPVYEPTYEQAQFNQPETKRALAMILYVSGLIGLVIGLVVRDASDGFITHHLNNCVVLTIGFFISSMLSVFGIGFLLMMYLFVMIVMGMVSAYRGDTSELPLIGKIKILK